MPAQTQTQTHHAILVPGDESAVGGPVVITHLCDAHWLHKHTHHAIMMPGDESAVGGPVVITHLCDAH